MRTIAAAALLITWALPAAAGTVRTINADSFYPEGPLWHDGRLLYVEYAANTVMAWDGTSNIELWKQDGCGPAAVIAWQGDLLVTCYDANTLVRIAADGTTVASIDRDADGKPLLGPNDATADGRGGLWLSMSGVYDAAAAIQGMVYHLSADGALRPMADMIHYSNGLAVTDDGRTLLVAEMLAARILAFAIAADGTLGQRRVLARMADIVPTPPDADAYYGPDGIKVGRDGRLYIAANGAGAVLVTDANGKLLARLDVPARFVTNVGFGADEDTLFVTAAVDAWNEPYPGAVYEIDLR